MPITFEQQYLQDAVEKQEALIRSLADSISSDDAGAALLHGDAARVEQHVRRTVDLLADRMSVGVNWS